MATADTPEGARPMTGLQDRLAARAANVDTAPHLIVEAYAGTGKTTTLVGGLQVMLGRYPVDGRGNRLDPSPQQRAVWDQFALSTGKARTAGFVAFNKSIADELKRRVPPGVEAMTNHGLGFRAVGRAFKGVRVQEYRASDIIGRLTNRNTNDLRREKPVLVAATLKLVSLCKMNLTDTREPEALADLAAHYDVELGDDRGRDFTTEVFDLVPAVLEKCADVRADNAIDFDDMIWLPVTLDLPVSRFDVLCVDEAQDLNRCQQELVKRAGNRVVLCGDRNQAIYGFAGADSDSLPRMTADLKATDRGAEVLPLTVTRRCGKAIVAAARKYVPAFEAHESNPAGEVRTAALKAESPTDYRKVVADGDMVICRTNAPLVSECFKFIKAGRRAEIQGRDVGKGLISTVTRSGAKTVGKLLEWLDVWLDAEIQKEQAKKNPSETRVQGLQDRYDCLTCFTADLTPADPVEKVVRKIEDVFTDSKESKGIKLSSMHRSKGLESARVFILLPEQKWGKKMKAWEEQQSRNLEYVAITRAIEVLVYVS